MISVLTSFLISTLTHVVVHSSSHASQTRRSTHVVVEGGPGGPRPCRGIGSVGGGGISSFISELLTEVAAE